jgi:uncharacterized protein (DUF2147 family)
MKFSHFCCASAVVSFALALSAGTALADPKGLWQAEDGAQVRVNNCTPGSPTLCATIAAAKSSVDPETGAPWTDKHNPDPAQRGRPLVGVYVLYSMTPDGPGKWAGQLYNTENGNSYNGRLIELGPQTIRIEGCVIGICGGRNLSRLR